MISEMLSGHPSLDSLTDALSSIGKGAIAVSGGVDSMTLAYVAHQVLGERVSMFHATSAAVPSEATARVNRYAKEEGWAFHLLDAGEFRNTNYLNNPVDRCYYCKTHLYYAIQAAASHGVLMSGTNTDDLNDYRPGLQAAAEHQVRHPFVEAGIAKEEIRSIARHLGLDDLAELPGAPCLSSRIETGIVIEVNILNAVNRTERLLERQLAPKTVRCRVRRNGVVIELDPETLARLTPALRQELEAKIIAHFDPFSDCHREIQFASYKMGSAFITSPKTNDLNQ